MTAAGYARTLDLVTRVRGVRGAMLVSSDDGLVVAEHLMEGIKGSAVAALAASLANRLRRAMVAAGVGASVFWHLQCEQGAAGRARGLGDHRGGGGRAGRERRPGAPGAVARREAV